MRSLSGRSSIEFLDPIKAQILSDDCKWVSFDIFDTLLLRYVWEPTDLFFPLGIAAGINRVAAFSRRRRKAERLARLCHVGGEVRIADIYARYASMLGISQEDADWLAKLEIGLERDAVYARATGKDLYHLAMAQGKKVIYITDMYLPAGAVAGILERCGYRCDEKNLFISGERGAGKWSGGLYRQVLEGLNIPSPEMLVHIGDNYHADVQMAAQNGIRSFWLPAVKDFSAADGTAPPVRSTLGFRVEMAAAAASQYDSYPNGAPPMPEPLAKLIDQCARQTICREYQPYKKCRAFVERRLFGHTGRALL